MISYKNINGDNHLTHNLLSQYFEVGASFVNVIEYVCMFVVKCVLHISSRFGLCELSKSGIRVVRSQLDIQQSPPNPLDKMWNVGKCSLADYQTHYTIYTGCISTFCC